MQSLFPAGLHHGDEFGDAAGSRLNDLWNSNIQLCAVSHESVSIELSNLHNGLVLTLCTLEHLIFTGISIGRQVANVSNVHNTLNIISQILQCLLQDIFHDVSAQIADMRKVVHSRTTGIHLNYIRGIGLKQLLLMSQGIIKIHNLTSIYDIKKHLLAGHSTRGGSYKTRGSTLIYHF